VASHSPAIAARIGNFVAIPATSLTDLEVRTPVTTEQFDREKKYRAALTIGKFMLKQELITDLEFQAIDAFLVEKFDPVFGGLSG